MTTNFNDNYEPVRLPQGHIHNLQASWGSATTLAVAAGECRDSTDSINIVLETGVTINTAVTGVNGLDTGALANSTPYYVHALKDTSGALSPCAILSASATAPVMPTVNGVTYDAFRVVDYWMTDGSANLLKGYTRGKGSERVRYWDTCVAALSGGTATSLTGIDLSAALPPVSGLAALLMVAFTPATASDKVSFAPFGSTATVLPYISGSVAAKVNSGVLEIPAPLNSTAPTVLYINSAASGATTVTVQGFRYSL